VTARRNPSNRRKVGGTVFTRGWTWKKKNPKKVRKGVKTCEASNQLQGGGAAGQVNVHGGETEAEAWGFCH